MAVHYAIDIFIPWLAHTELYPRENWPLFLWHNNGCNQKCWSYTRMIQDLFTVYRLTSEKLCLSKLIFSNWTNLLEGAASLVIVGAVGGFKLLSWISTLHRYFSRVWHIFLFVWPLIELNVGFEFYLFSFRWFIQGEVRYCSPSYLVTKKVKQGKVCCFIYGRHCLIFC